MWSVGKHKSHASLNLQGVGFGWSKALCDAATDGRLNGKKAYRDTPLCAKNCWVIHISGRICYSYCEVDFEVPIILGRPFLATGRALVNMEKGQMKFRLNNEEATFNVCRTMRQSGELQSVSAIYHKEKMKKETYQKMQNKSLGLGIWCL